MQDYQTQTGSLRTKLLLIFGLSATVMLTAALFAVSSMWSGNDAMVKASNNNQVANELVITFKKQVQEWKDVLLRGSDPIKFDKYWGNFEADEEAIQKNGQELLGQIDNPAIKSKLAEFLDTHKEMGKAYRAGLEAYKKAGYVSSVGDKAVAGIDRAPTKALEKVAAGVLNETKAMAQDARQNVIVCLVVTIIAAFASFVALFWATTSMIVRPASELVEDIRRIAGGDFSQNIRSHGNDEFTQIATSAREITRQVGGLVRELHTVVGSLSAAAEQVGNTATRSVTLTREQATKTDEAAVAMNEMVSSVQDVSRNTAEASNATQQANDQARQGNDLVGEVIGAIQDLSQEVHNAASVATGLKEQADKIGTVVDVIGGIAEQTNLLALNAAIEAARAGEQGRGFAVVADEVRTLANRTQHSTLEIQSMIAALQQGVNGAVVALEKGRKLADSSVGQAETGGDAISQIASSVATIYDMNAQISSAVHEQEAVAEDINRHLVQIRDISENTVSDAQDNARAAQELGTLAKRIDSLVEKLRA
jgi:methyl-accepting chemotaxis protein